MSDLDNEELKATKKLYTKEIEKSSSIKEKQEKSSCIEKSADEMFEELGYWKESEWYYRKPRKRLSDLQIRFIRDYKMFVVESGFNMAQNITMQELQAINKKCKELGWL